LRLYYITQPEVHPPTFVITASRPDLIQPSYRRYLMRELRRAFGFVGTPIRLKFHGRGRTKHVKA